MHIQNGNLTIRAALASDAQTLCRWWNDGAVMAHAGFPLGLGTTPEKVAVDLASDIAGVHERLVLELGGQSIGEMNYRRVGDSTAEIGIKICEASMREQGLGRRALSMLIRELFAAQGFEKIVLDTNLKNTRAQHVYEKLGFHKLRVNTDAWKDQLGEPQSSVDYELTRERFIDFSV